MKIINEINPNLKSLNSIAKSLGKFRKGIEKRFDELGISGSEYKNIRWFSDEEIEKLKEYLNSFDSSDRYKFSINDFAKELNKDYGTIKRCIDFLEIKGFKNLQNKTYYDENDKLKLYDFVQSNSSDIQRILAKNTFSKKYNCENPMQNEEIKNKNRKNFSNNMNKYVYDFEKKNNIKLISTANLCKKYNRDKTTFYLIYKKLNINVYSISDYDYINFEDLSKLDEYFKLTNNSMISFMEKEILTFIKSIYNGEVLENDRTVIKPKELDIYIPSKNLAIEFDGLYWHSELFVDKNYHLNKTIACNDKKIDLIHVFEDDWRDKKEIVKSMIASRLGIYSQKIFARNCKFMEISKKQAEEFLTKNHLQGYARTCNHHYGLIFNDELVQMISITNKGFHDGNTELTRMATKLNTQVVGGFSKLVKNYCTSTNTKELVSYVYTAWFNGKGYLESNFKIIKTNKPSYYYILNNKRLHKSHFRKNNLLKMYNDKIINYYDESESESNICNKNKIYKIYDCGTLKVKYTL